MKVYRLIFSVVLVLILLSSCKGKDNSPSDDLCNPFHDRGEAVIENEIPATCTENGSYDEVVYCNVCGEELSRKTKKIKCEGHTEGDEVRENEIPVSCTADGKYDVVIYCVSCGEELDRESVKVESEGHQIGDPITENEILADCYNDGGYDSVRYCTLCREEMERETIIVESTGHTEGEEIITDVVEPTCKGKGSCLRTVRCFDCDEIMSSENTEIPANGHSWADGKCDICGAAYSVAECLELALSEDGSYYIITGIGTFTDSILRMPSEYKGLPIKEIADYAFLDCDFVVEAYIPESITRLGYGAAKGCTGIKKLVLEDRSGWSLYDGWDDPKIFPIPAFMLVDLSNYFDLLIYDDRFALVK